MTIPLISTGVPVDWQSAFNVIFSLAGAMGGWILKTLHDEIKEARADHGKLTEALPGTYARKDDMVRSLDQIGMSLRDINGKLDRIAER